MVFFNISLPFAVNLITSVIKQTLVNNSQQSKFTCILLLCNTGITPIKHTKQLKVSI